MNSLKNLMIIGVLAAVGYGVYVSLQRNNVDSEQPFGTAKTDVSSAKPSASRGLPLSGSPAVGDSGGLGAAPTLSAPPIAPPLVQTPALTPPANSSATTSPTPLPSSASNAPLTPPSFSPSGMTVLFTGYFSPTSKRRTVYSVPVTGGNPKEIILDGEQPCFGKKAPK